jgi:hypothetical protein
MKHPLISRWWIGVLVVMVLVGLVIGTLWATNALGWRRWRIQEVQAFIGANLPPSASNIQFATESAHTRIIWLRFDLPTGDDGLNALLAEEPLLTGFTPFPQPNPQEAALAWWTPRAATLYSGVHRITSTQVFEVLVDESDPARRIVYLRVYNLA